MMGPQNAYSVFQNAVQKYSIALQLPQHNSKILLSSNEVESEIKFINPQTRGIINAYKIPTVIYFD